MTKFFVEDIILETEDEKKQRLVKEMELEVAKLELELVENYAGVEKKKERDKSGLVLGVLLGFVTPFLISFIVNFIDLSLGITKVSEVYFGYGLGLIAGFTVTILFSRYEKHSQKKVE